MKAATDTFSTVAEDHANCSVGSVTHGFKTLEEVGSKSDVGALVGAGWVAPEMFPQIPVVKERFRYVTYGPLKDSQSVPDVVFLRINAKQAMTLSDASRACVLRANRSATSSPLPRSEETVAVSVGACSVA